MLLANKAYAAVVEAVASEQEDGSPFTPHQKGSTSPRRLGSVAGISPQRL